MARSKHQSRVAQFMQLARQELPLTPAAPSEKVCKLRSELCLEELLELITEGLGIDLQVLDAEGKVLTTLVPRNKKQVRFVQSRPVDLVAVADGIADLSVVNIGTALACGIEDEEVLEAVDNNNNAKFRPGHSWSESGKLIKPPGHKKVDLASVLARQSAKYGYYTLVPASDSAETPAQ